MEKSVSLQIQAPYYTLGTLDSATKAIWIVLHGYGQLASFFIKKFEALSAQSIYVIAPQGLNRFYLQDAHAMGRVGANWMTKHDRLEDIRRYVRYLDEVYAQEIKGMGFSHLPVYILGFSQGCATASRWIAQGKVKCVRFVCWAGEMAPEALDAFRHIPITMVYGTQDSLISAEILANMKEKLIQHQLEPETIIFEGGHEIEMSIVRNLAGQWTDES